MINAATYSQLVDVVSTRKAQSRDHRGSVPWVLLSSSGSPGQTSGQMASAIWHHLVRQLLLSDRASHLVR